MFGELKSLVKHGSVYTLGTILGKIVSFLLIPVYTNYLTPAQYGTLELLDLTIDIISFVIGLGMGAAVMRFYYQHDNDANKRKVISSALLGSITLMGLTTVICFIFAPFFAQLIFSSTENTIYFRVIFVSMFFNSGIGIALTYLRAKLRSGSFVLINLIKMTIQLTLNIYFLVVLGLGVLGVLYSGLIAAAFVGLYLFISTFREVGFKFDPGIYRQMLRYGAPLIIAEISIFALTYADRYFLNYMTDLTAVGIYSIAYKFGMLVTMLYGGPFWAIWSAKMFEFAKQDNAKELFSKTLNYFLMGGLAISLGISLFTKDVLRIMSEASYWSAYKIVPFVCLSYVLSGVIAIAGAGTLIANKTKYKAISTSAAMVVNLILNYLFIPKWGGLGAAVATLIAFGVRLWIDVYYSQRLFYIPFDWPRIWKMSLIYLIFSSAPYVLDIENVAVSVAANSVVFVAFIVLLFASGILVPEEKKYIGAFVKNRLRGLRVAASLRR